ncbi:hypothetical protein ES708_17807 [subsurface metagenome]
MKKDKTILIVGLGAIGSVIFSRLIRKDYQVVCLTSQKGTEKIREKGLRVKIVGDLNPQLHECEVYDILPENYVFETCIVTAKSWLNKQIVKEVSSNLSNNATILLFQNGLKVEDPFLHETRKWKIFRAITSIAAARNEKNEAIEINTGFTKVGRVNDKTHKTNIWIRLLTAVGIPVTASNNINREIWSNITIVNNLIRAIPEMMDIARSMKTMGKQELKAIVTNFDNFQTIVKMLSFFNERLSLLAEGDLLDPTKE